MSDLPVEIIKEVPVSISDITSPGGVPGYTRPINTKGLSVVERIDRYREHALAVNGSNPEVSPAVMSAVRKALQHEAFLLSGKEEEARQKGSRGGASTIDISEFVSEPEPSAQAQSPGGPIGDEDLDGEHPTLAEVLDQREKDSDLDMMLDDMVAFFGTPVSPINFDDGEEEATDN